MVRRYKYESAHEWLELKAATWTYDELLGQFKQLIYKLDGDTIQDQYQDDMDRDGYFEEATE